MDEPELYVNLLVTDRSHTGMGIGARLLAHARQVAADRGAGMLRVDCCAGGDRALVRYHEGQGFTAADPFTVQLAGGPVWSWRDASAGGSRAVPVNTFRNRSTRVT